MLAGCSSQSSNLFTPPANSAPSSESGTANDTAGAAGSGASANGGAGASGMGSGGRNGAGSAGGTTGGAGSGSAGDTAGNGGWAPNGPVELAPYFPAWSFGARGYAYTSLVNLKQLSELNDLTLAFVIATPGAGCMPDLATDGIGANLADIRAFQAAGGHLRLSFGGADGVYLQDPNACADALQLAAAIGSVIDATGITDLDFDVEQPFNSGMSDDANQHLGAALHSLQTSKAIQVTLTLQHTLNGDDSSSQGLDATALDLIRAVLAAGVKLEYVNVMTMGYGPLVAPMTEAVRAIATLNAAQKQLKGLMPALSDQQVWALLGVTPEIGANDSTAEIFTADDATVVGQFAIDHRMGLASFWSIDRDRTCAGACGFQKYSTVNAANFQFAKAFAKALK